MRNMPKKQVIELIHQLEDASKELEKHKDFDLKKLEEIAERYLDKKSEFLAGVSGGIVAFVGGFYEELIYSLQKVNAKAFKLLINGRFKSFFQYTNARFLVLILKSCYFTHSEKLQSPSF